MNRLFRPVLVVLSMLLCNISFAEAQQFQKMPLDAKVRIGKLDNGLTYYIRHNAKPEKRAEFYIAQKVGAILEEPEQRGLAHFLEHMAFNGTKNFPGDDKGMGIIKWCETKGIKFGEDLNAYTGVDETVYNISNVPTNNIQVVDSCLLILHDWSGAILLRDEEIDKERGVIREEWRSTNSGMQRVISNALPTLYPDSKYSDCMPIGSIDVINNFPYKAIKDYYHKWYRPDQQGLIIVGDIDVDYVEAKLKELFKGVKAPVNPAVREYYPVADNKEPIVFIGKDKELTSVQSIIYFKNEPIPSEVKETPLYLVFDYIKSSIISMANSRMYELSEKPNSPFIGASLEYGQYLVARTKEAYGLSVACRPNKVAEGMQAALSELEKIKRYGFTYSEYERAKANFLNALDVAYKEKDNRKNGTLVNLCLQHFLHSEPLVDVEYSYQLMKQITEGTTLEQINQVAKTLFEGTNQVAIVAGPEKEDIAYPTEQQVLDMLKNMPNLQLEAYEDKVNNEPLLSKEPKAGKVIKRVDNDIYGSTKLILSNGVKVYIKPTDFKADQIIMSALSWGGHSLFSDKDIYNIKVINSVAQVGGIGNFDKVSLGKALSGKNVSASTSISDRTEEVSGSCSPKDFETMLQLTYLEFTSPRKDKEAFDAFATKYRDALRNAYANPMKAFGDSLSVYLYGNHPRAVSFKESDVDKINYDRVLEMYAERFADASDFTFFFVGNIDADTAIPFIEKYIASLPSIKRKEYYRDNKMYILKGKREHEFEKQQESHMATIFYSLTGDVKYSLKTSLTMDILSEALTMVYTDEIREKEGGTYGVSCSGSISRHPIETMGLQIYFQTDPEKRNHLSKLVLDQLYKMAEQGPSEENVKKIKEFMIKQVTASKKENSYWMNALTSKGFSGLEIVEGYEETVNSITVDDVKALLNDLLKQNNIIKAVMTSPEKK